MRNLKTLLSPFVSLEANHFNEQDIVPPHISNRVYIVYHDVALVKCVYIDDDEKKAGRTIYPIPNNLQFSAGINGFSKKKLEPATWANVIDILKAPHVLIYHNRKIHLLDFF